jgi:competence protein ComEC
MSLLRRAVALLSLLVCAQALAGLPPPAAGQLTVYFLDVGQGDAALVVSPTGKTVLVDGGPPDAGMLSRKLTRLLGAPLDLVVLSHPHLDHLGGLPAVLESPGARRYMDPGFDHPTAAYRDLLRQVGAKEIPFLEPEPGPGGAPFQLELGGGVTLTVLWPRRPAEPFLTGTRSDANSNSIVFRLDHAKTSFLFTGDAEADTESRLLRSGQKLSATVLKAPHHGSRHSSGERFLERVSPKAVVVSSGRQNEYGHPHEHALGRYQAAGAAVYRTDAQGDLVAVSDGVTVTIRPARAFAAPPIEPASATVDAEPPAAEPPASPAGGGFAASRRSEVFHREACPTVQRIAPHNLVRFDSRAEAEASRRPSGDCQP